MTHSNDVPGPDSTDYKIALTVGICGLALYVRTLAPDILYGDSAEFQTLAYTLGMTHSTGYPIYLLFARLVGFLPIASPAWRVNLVSALCAAWTVGGVYLLARYFTPNRTGAVLGSIALALSYTFWAQAIIAEVYTPGMAVLTTVLLLLARWQREPFGRRRALAWATGLTCLALGVHLSATLIAPTALLFVLWVVAFQPKTQWWPILRYAFIGFGIGIVVYFTAFILLDLNNPPSSFIQVMLYPSRSVWGLTAAELDSVFTRWWLTVMSVQWRDVMFPEGGFAVAISEYFNRVLSQEFSLWMIGFALLGLGEINHSARRLARNAGNPELETPATRAKAFVKSIPTAPTLSLGVFMVVTYLVMLAFVLNYRPGDQYVFYLVTYIFISTAIGVGIGRTLEWTKRFLGKRKNWTRYLYPPVAVLCALVVVAAYADARWDALKAGKGTFVQEMYPYPLDNLQEPRQIYAMRLFLLPEDAYVVMNWRGLYSMYYLAHVEGLRPNIVIKEATPYGSNNQIADSLLEEMIDTVRAGERPVFVDQIYPGLRDHFRVMPTAGGNFYRLTIPRN
ncbi:MAG: glycosyltransferase family 117 protein [Anaerolineae bacterium]